MKAAIIFWCFLMALVLAANLMLFFSPKCAPLGFRMFCVQHSKVRVPR